MSELGSCLHHLCRWNSVFQKVGI